MFFESRNRTTLVVHDKVTIKFLHIMVPVCPVPPCVTLVWRPGGALVPTALRPFPLLRPPSQHPGENPSSHGQGAWPGLPRRLQRRRGFSLPLHDREI